MKTSAKNIASLLIVVLILSAFSVPTFASTPENGKINVLNQLGMLKISKAVDETVTRGEFAKILVDYLNLTQTFEKAKMLDLTEETAYLSEINTAISYDLMNGNDENMFLPNTPIILNDVLSVLLKSMGYSDLATAKNGYYSIANDVGMLRGISGVTPESTVKFSQLSDILYSGMTVDLMVKIDGKNYTKIAVKNGQNILTQYHNIYVKNGTITACNGTTLKTEIKMQADEIFVDGVKYIVDENSKLRTMLGFPVKIYYKNNSEGENYLIKAWEQRKKIDEVSFSASDITSFANLTYKIEQNGKNFKYVLTSNADVVYNSIATQDFTMDDFVPKNGSIRLLDRDNDGNYDLVFINDIKDLVVQNVDNNKIYFKNGESLLISDLKDLNIYDAEQNIAEIGDLVQWDIVSLGRTKSGKMRSAYLSTRKISGSISEVIEGKQEIIFIDNVPYELSKTCYYEESANLQIGDVANLYLNSEGKIAAINGDNTSGFTYAYLISVENDTGMWGNLKVKMYDFYDEQVKVVRLAKIVDIDNVRYKNTNSDGILNHIKRAKIVLNREKDLKNSYPIRNDVDSDELKKMVNYDQLIRYKFNTNDELRGIDTAFVNVDNNESDQTLHLSPYARGGGEKLIRTELKTYGGAICYNGNTKILYAPTVALKNENSMYAMRKTSMFADYDMRTYEVYCTESDAIADVFFSKVSNVTSTLPSLYSKLTLVNKIVEVYDDVNQQMVRKIYGVQDNKERVLIEEIPGTIVMDKESNDQKNTIDVGDLVAFTNNIKGRLSTIEKIYDFSQDRMCNDKSDSWYNGLMGSLKYEYTIGVARVYVYSIEGDIVATVMNDPATTPVDKNTKMQFFPVSKFNLTMFDMSGKNNVTTLGSVKDLKDFKSYGNPCSKLVIHIKDGEALGMFVYSVPSN